MMSVDYSRWIGSKEDRVDNITLSRVHAVLDVLDDSITVLKNGHQLPPLWHWFFFLPRAPMSQMDSDGHPKRGDFLPPIKLPRRMFAGARMVFHNSLIIGQSARRIGEVTTIQEKGGSTGTLVFVTVRYMVTQNDQLCVEEEQDIVYLQSMTSTLHAPIPVCNVPYNTENAWVETVVPTPVLLFRFSAITFNSHRIHYDRPYAMEKENYPGLVVHGPLTATLLMNLVRLKTDHQIESYSFRGRMPLFDIYPFHLIGRPCGNKIELEAQGPDGVTCMTAEVKLR